MKKLLLIIVSVLHVTSASAELGVNIGASASVGLFAATGNEIVGASTHTVGTNRKNNGEAFGSAGWGSVFIEKTLGNVLFVGADYVPGALSTDTTETANKSERTGTASTQKIQIDFEDLTTFYVGAKIGENFYAKAGTTHVDIVTNENLGTGSTYANTNMDGTMLGMGYNHTTDNGAFVRIEGTYMSFDGAFLDSTTNSNRVTLSNLDGVSGKLSVGKSF